MSLKPEATILIVDDDPLQRQYLANKLRPRYAVIEAHDGEHAIELASRIQPDLILLDLKMRPIDGVTCCMLLKKDPALAEIPVIFLTAMIGVEEEVRCLEAGAVDFIRKPANAAALQARICNQLQQKARLDGFHKSAWTDALTGVANRQRFDEHLDQEWETCRREGSPLHLILFDLDHFKEFNDHRGHLVGDDCLRKVATHVSTLIRGPRDLFGRYGGEEFACILPTTPISEVICLAQVMRVTIQGLGISHPGSAVAGVMTASFGIASLQPTEYNSVRELFAQADANLYQAKRNGKNCVVSGPTSIEAESSHDRTSKEERC